MVAAAQGLDSVHRLAEPAGLATAQLAYALPDFGIHMPFRPTDFTQVNPISTACWLRARWACWRCNATSG